MNDGLTIETLKELRGNMTGFASIVGCYSMHLYCALRCDRRLESPQRYQFTGPTESNCRKQARAYGWSFNNGEAVCPRCSDQARAWKHSQEQEQSK